jgi:hypothetical protein
MINELEHMIRILKQWVQFWTQYAYLFWQNRIWSGICKYSEVFWLHEHRQLAVGENTSSMQ